MTKPAGELTPNELRELVASHEFWWHRIDLGKGIVTPEQADSGPTLPALHLPDTLAGKSVLDIGPWDGGIGRVLMIDHYTPTGIVFHAFI